MKLSEAWQGYLLELRARRSSPATVKWYENRLRRAGEALGDPDIRSVTTAILRKYFANLDATAQTAHGYFRALRALFRWLEVEGELEVSPVKKVRAPKVPTTIKPRYTDTEIKTLVAVCGLRDRALLLVLADSGVRASEALGLDVRDLHLDSGWVLVRGKGSKEREVPISDRAAKALWRWLAHREEKVAPVFTGPGGRRLSYEGLRDVMRRLSAKTGIEVGAHKFRHTFASRVGGKINPFALQKVLGHSSLAMTRHYTQLGFDDVQEEYKRVTK